MARGDVKREFQLVFGFDNHVIEVHGSLTLVAVNHDVLVPLLVLSARKLRDVLRYQLLTMRYLLVNCRTSDHQTAYLLVHLVNLDLEP